MDGGTSSRRGSLPGGLSKKNARESNSFTVTSRNAAAFSLKRALSVWSRGSVRSRKMCSTSFGASWIATSLIAPSIWDCSNTWQCTPSSGSAPSQQSPGGVCGTGVNVGVGTAAVGVAVGAVMGVPAGTGEGVSDAVGVCAGDVADTETRSEPAPHDASATESNIIGIRPTRPRSGICTLISRLYPRPHRDSSARYDVRRPVFVPLAADCALEPRARGGVKQLRTPPVSPQITFRLLPVLR